MIFWQKKKKQSKLHANLNKSTSTVCVACAGVSGVRSPVPGGSQQHSEGRRGRLRCAGKQHLLREEAQTRLQTAGPARPGQRTCGWHLLNVTHGDWVCVCVPSPLPTPVTGWKLSASAKINSLTSHLCATVSHSLAVALAFIPPHLHHPSFPPSRLSLFWCWMRRAGYLDYQRQDKPQSGCLAQCGVRHMKYRVSTRLCLWRHKCHTAYTTSDIETALLRERRVYICVFFVISYFLLISFCLSFFVFLVLVFLVFFCLFFSFFFPPLLIYSFFLPFFLSELSFWNLKYWLFTIYKPWMTWYSCRE